MPDHSPTAPSARVSPYGSARDLPTFVEMADSLKAMKALTVFIARDKRQELVAIERQMNRLADVVDRFYDVLGPRNWIFHDDLNVEEIAEFLDRGTTVDEVEDLLIGMYGRRLSEKWFTARFRGVEALRKRAHLIERARNHHLSQEYDSCVLHLVSVMDGFINDYQPANRKGLHARDPDDMVAWDSVAGHHLGLSHVLKTFLQTIKKPVEDEVYEIYRHGIVHGTVLRYDNAVVSCKAWNMLHGLVDWARATEKRAQPVKEAPTLRDTMRQLVENRKV